MHTHWEHWEDDQPGRYAIVMTYVLGVAIGALLAVAL
jgi:hypothetical protein